MKSFSLKRIFCLALAALLLLTAAPVAFAEETEETPYTDFEHLDWDQVINGFLSYYGVSEESVALGYYNTVTGEEYYYNGDQYMDAGSMYKVPLNMVFAEKVANGELDPDGELNGVSYQYLLHETIVNSSNDMARFMWTVLGSYYIFRRTIAPYMGEDADNVDWKYYENNFFTPRQMITCLKLLYNEKERFPNVIETMLQAEPDNYFRKSEKRYPIAHKYGYNIVDDVLHMNDCGIVYTDDPIIIVIFTSGIAKPYTVITKYCTLMCDYTNYYTEKRAAEEALEAQRAADAEEAATVVLSFRNIASYVPQSLKAAAISAAAEADPDGKAYSMSPTLLVITVLLLLLIVLCIGFLVRRNRGERIGTFWAVICILASGLAALALIAGSVFGTVFAKIEEDPCDTVTEFFSELKAGDYSTACSRLSNYSDLGMTDTEPDADGKLVLTALQESYDSKIMSSEVDKATATVNVHFRHLSLPELDTAIQDNITDTLRVVVTERAGQDVYEEDGNYTEEIIDSTYTRALESMLKNPSKYYKSEELTLNLRYSDGAWYIVADEALIQAISGGVEG